MANRSCWWLLSQGRGEAGAPSSPGLLQPQWPQDHGFERAELSITSQKMGMNQLVHIPHGNRRRPREMQSSLCLSPCPKPLYLKAGWPKASTELVWKPMARIHALNPGLSMASPAQLSAALDTTGTNSRSFSRLWHWGDSKLWVYLPQMTFGCI